MIRVRQLCGGGPYGETPYWITTTWFGVRLATCVYWLKHCGWGLNRCGCGWVACNHTPRRLRLKGRCWIEDVERPAVAQGDQEYFTGRLPPVPMLERPEVKAALARAAAVTGRRGGQARAKKLSPERRSEIARDAARRRWKKR